MNYGYSNVFRFTFLYQRYLRFTTLYSVTMLDSDCSSKQSLGILTDQLFVQPLDVVIGPPCADGRSPLLFYLFQSDNYYKKRVLMQLQLTFDISKLKFTPKLLISQSKFSGPRKFTLRYQ